MRGGEWGCSRGLFWSMEKHLSALNNTYIIITIQNIHMAFCTCPLVTPNILNSNCLLNILLPTLWILWRQGTRPVLFIVIFPVLSTVPAILDKYLSSNSNSGYIHNRTERRYSNRYLYTHVSQQQHSQYPEDGSNPSVPSQMNEQNVMHAMKYYSNLQEKTVLTHPTRWMNLENNMPSEIHQTQRDKYSVSSYIRYLE